MAKEQCKSKPNRKMSSTSKKIGRNKQVSNILHYKTAKPSSNDSGIVPDIEAHVKKEQNEKNEKIEDSLTTMPDNRESSRLENINEEPSEIHNTSAKTTVKMSDVNSIPTSEAEVFVVNYNMSDIESKKDDSPIAGPKSELKTVPQYSPSFLLNQNVQQEMFQQNLLAQQLLVKYFNKEEQDKQKSSDEINAQALNIIHTVSSLLRRCNHITDKSEQVCIKPSDMYVFSNDVKILAKPSNVKILRPYRYHKYFLDSVANLNLELPSEPIQIGSRLFCDFYEDSLARSRSSSEQVRFLNTKFSRSGQVNKILYKNDSRNLDKDFSCDDFQGLNFPVITERYLSLRNLYSNSYLGGYNHQRRPLSKSASTFGVRFNSNVDFRISDEEYKSWLKQNDLIKYSNLSVTTNYTDSSRDSTCEDLMHLSVSQTVGPQKCTQHNENRNCFGGNEASRDPHYSSFHELIICEHIVISNFIYFFSYYFFAKRLRTLTIGDRIGQLMFFIMSYYVIVLLNSSGIKDIGNTFNFKDIF